MVDGGTTTTQRRRGRSQSAELFGLFIHGRARHQRKHRMNYEMVLYERLSSEKQTCCRVQRGGREKTTSMYDMQLGQAQWKSERKPSSGFNLLLWRFCLSVCSEGFFFQHSIAVSALKSCSQKPPYEKKPFFWGQRSELNFSPGRWRSNVSVVTSGGRIVNHIHPAIFLFFKSSTSQNANVA